MDIATIRRQYCFKNLHEMIELRSIRTLLFGGVGFFFLISLYLALCRIYQVDEAQWAFTARMLALKQIDKYFISAPLFLFPFLHIIGNVKESVNVLDILRLGFLGIFWLNIFLLVKASGQRLRLRLLPIYLIIVLPYAPLWTYGLEVRHENLILTGLLLSWILVRSKALSSFYIFMGLGFLAVLMQACTYKAIAYWLSIDILILIFPPYRHKMIFCQRSMCWIVGFFTGTVLLYFVHSFTGTWDLLWKQNLHAIKAIATTIATKIDIIEADSSFTTFPPWRTLWRLFLEMPIPFAVAVAVLISVIGSIIRSGWIAVTWESKIPELLLCIGSFGILIINPNPFPYNMLIPSAMLLIILLPESLELMKDKSKTLMLIVIIWLFVQGGLYGQQIKTLLQSGNNRQIILIRAAEELTEPSLHLVFDAAGLVSTRFSIGPVWLVNILNIKAIQTGSLPTIYEELSEHPPAVVIPTYRFGYLGNKEFHFFKQNYISLASDFWVLGNKSKKEKMEWNCILGGRYILTNNDASKIHKFQVNGEDMPSGIHTFKRGRYMIKGSVGSQPCVAWLGPTRKTLPDLNLTEIKPGVFPIPGGF